MNPDYRLIPEHMRAGAKLYIEMGITPGSFLYFLLADEKWSDVLSMADHINRRSLYEWRMFISTIPMACWGSRENVQRWIDSGGMAGYLDQQCEVKQVND